MVGTRVLSMELAAPLRRAGERTSKARNALDRRQEPRVLRSRRSTECVVHLRYRRSSPSVAAFAPEATSPVGRLFCMSGKPCKLYSDRHLERLAQAQKPILLQGRNNERGRWCSYLILCVQIVSQCLMI